MSRRNPFDDIERMFDQLSEQFETLDPTDIGIRAGEVPIDLRDEGEQLVVVADLPGYDSADIDVTLPNERTLKIVAERESEAETDDEGIYVRRERRESVRRSVSLPDAVDDDTTSASYEDGVLRVTLPKQTADTDDGHSIPVN